MAFPGAGVEWLYGLSSLGISLEASSVLHEPVILLT